MVLSNWGALAVRFEISERNHDEEIDPPRPELAELEQARQRRLKELQAMDQQVKDIFTDPGLTEKMDLAEETNKVRGAEWHSSNGVLSVDGVSVEIYKNWLRPNASG